MWTAVYKKLWIVILVPIVAGGIAWFVTGKDAGLYKSTAVVEASIPDKTAENPKTLKDIPEPDQYYENLVETMKTEVITSMASYRLLIHDLEKEIAFRPPAIQYSEDRKKVIRATLEKKLASFDLLSETDPTEQTIFKIIHNTDYNVGRWVRDEVIAVKRKPGSNDIEVSCTSEDPFLSAFAANALSQEYIRYETRNTVSVSVDVSTNDSTAIYRDEVERLRRALEQKTEEFNQASSKTQTPVDDVRFRRAKADRIAEYEMKIVEAEWEITKTREQLAKVPQPTATQQKQAAADVGASAKIKTIRKKIDQLSRIYIEGGSKDKKLDSIIHKLRKQFDDETARLQLSSQKPAVASTTSGSHAEYAMLSDRLRRHEENIESLRNDIRRLKNTGPKVNTNAGAVAQLKQEKEQAEKEYNLALNKLKRTEIIQAPVSNSGTRANHYLVLKAKALPSAEPESPWALAIVIAAIVGSLATVIIIIAVTKPAPPPDDSIFLRVNYANRNAQIKKHPA